jgi:UDP-N-acetylmuramoyl-tripeptide--D-alanyl-D-alanine ligase
MPMTLHEVADAVGGALAAGADPAAAVDAVVTDSRAVAGLAAAGARPLFAAVPGERTDGHDHAGAALAAGAVAVLAERAVDAPSVLAPATTLEALTRLAAAALERRRAHPAPLDVIGVTGSSGKTTTKDLLAAVLAPAGEVVAPPGSYNNELGVPLTVLRAAATTRCLVLEMGARRIGNIAELAALARPRVGAVLNVGSAHVGVFGGPEAVARAKGELVEALPAAAEGGVAVLNADDLAVAAMASRTRAAVLTFGLGASAQVRATGVALDAAGRARFDLHLPGAGPVAVALRLHGEHHVENALAAAACAHAVGVGAEQVAAALSAAAPASRHRMEVTDRPDGVTVVDDAYNANPESVRAALRALTAMRGPGKERRTWAVLGEMLELGDTSQREHDAMGRYLVRLDISRLVAVGPGTRPLHLGAVMEGSWGEESAWVPDAEAALALLRAELAPGDVVLVKGSNATGLHALAEALATDGATDGATSGAGERGGAP